MAHPGAHHRPRTQDHRKGGKEVEGILRTDNGMRLGDTTKLSQNALSRQRRGARASKSKRVPLPFDVGREGRAAAHHHGHERAERILTESEVHSMIALTTNKRDRVLLKILYVGGLRVAEALSLRTRDLKQRDEGGQVSLFGKGDKSHAVLLCPRAS